MVLCAYLGQLAKVRDALHNLVAVVIDERDQKELAEREEEVDEIRQETLVEHVKISSRVGLPFMTKQAKLTMSLLGSLTHSRQLSRRGGKGMLIESLPDWPVILRGS